MRRLAALALLALLAATCQAVVPSAAFVDWSYVNCQADAICAEAIPSGLDPVIFGEMLQAYIDGRQDAGVGVISLIEPCVQLVPPADDGLCPSTNCAGYQQLWLANMRDARVCGANEEWIEGHGCHCIEGRICGNYPFDRSSRLDVFIAGMVFGFVLLTSDTVWEELKRLRVVQKLEYQVSALQSHVYSLRVRLVMEPEITAASRSIEMRPWPPAN
jgi:hypothetical protein